MRIYLIACSAIVALFVIFSGVQGVAQTGLSSAVQKQVCAQPAAGSIVTNPPNLGKLGLSSPVNLTALKVSPMQDCYLANGNVVAPTLRVNPTQAGNTILVNLTNRLTGESNATTLKNDCILTGGTTPSNSTNLHFHGLNVSLQCHQDEVVKTVIRPNQYFQYQIAIPAGEPPGLYWYHPHIHMQSENQVLKGLTGAIIVEGIQKFNNRAAQLPERVFVLRDTPLVNTKQQCGYPYGLNCPPANDISINSVPIRYLGNGKYDPAAVIQMQVNQEQFWRVVNTAANTFFDLQVTYDGTAQKLELVALDGVPINSDSGNPQDHTLPVQHILLPPAARAEFIIKGPGANIKNAQLVTLKYDTGSQGNNNPKRTIARIDPQVVPSVSSAKTTTAAITEPEVDLTQMSGNRFAGLSQMTPVNQRRLFFSEDGSNFYITVQGNKPKLYTPGAPPDITVTEGNTEDWIVENRSQESHAFHIHQIHFLVLESSAPNEIGILRDTIDLPSWNGNPNTPYPHVKLRMDFRGAQHGSSIAGTFVYHCHILGHEDRGMMAKIQVNQA
ncbi:multicopper oxidase family protein [Nostoc sp.]|uniref:multicopper oxidase family protein n=1 Tax=Nostoc sp. TaxID=1180 RepID=UPI002FFC07CD